jgi:hypothetical protein
LTEDEYKSIQGVVRDVIARLGSQDDMQQAVAQQLTSSEQDLSDTIIAQYGLMLRNNGLIDGQLLSSLQKLTGKKDSINAMFLFGQAEQDVFTKLNNELYQGFQQMILEGQDAGDAFGHASRELQNFLQVGSRLEQLDNAAKAALRSIE